MKNGFKKFFGFIKKELQDLIKGIENLYHGNKRVILLLITLFILASTLDMFQVFKVSLTIPIFAATMAHMVRKILFPYLDTRKYLLIIERGFSKTNDHTVYNPMAAALVVVGVLFFMTILITVFSIKLF